MFSDGCNYDYPFIINELAGEFKEQSEWLGENTEKYIIFSVPVKKDNEHGKTITLKKNYLLV